MGSPGPWQHAAGREARQVRPRCGRQVDRPQDAGGSWCAADPSRLRPVLPRRLAHGNPRSGRSLTRWRSLRGLPWWASYAEPARTSAWRPANASVANPRLKPQRRLPRSHMAPGCRSCHLGRTGPCGLPISLTSALFRQHRQGDAEVNDLCSIPFRQSLVHHRVQIADHHLRQRGVGGVLKIVSVP